VPWVSRYWRARTAQIGFIFDEEDGLLPMLGTGKAKRILRGGGIFAAIDARKIGTQAVTALRLAVDEDKATALLHDAVHRREGEAGTLGALGSEEGLENAQWFRYPCRHRCH